MTDSYIILREWAYIMIIIVCFAILLTLISYALCFFISKFKNRKRGISEKLLDKSADMQQTEINSVVCELPNQSLNQKLRQNNELMNRENQDLTKSHSEANENLKGYLSNIAIAVKNFFIKQPMTEIPSIENLNQPTNLITVKRAAKDFGTSSSEGERDILDELGSNLNIKKKARSLRASMPESTLKDRLSIAEAGSRKGSQDSNSTRKSSIESNYSDYYQSSVASLYRQQRLSNASSIRSNKFDDLKNRQHQQRKQSIRYTSPFSNSNTSNMVSLECQLENNSVAHIAMPLDKSFIQTTLSNTANNQSYFADSHLKLQSRHYSIDTPNQSDEFWVPANIAKSAQLEKQRSSLPTNVPISFENSERKLKCQIIMASKINENTLADSSKMDSAYLSQLTSIDVTEDNLTNLTVPCNIKRRASMCDPIVLTEIAKDLYPLNSTSNNGSPLSNSPYSEVGLIEFRIQYFAESKKLVVELLRIFDLKLNETTSIRELYCKCKLIPDTFSFETKFLKASHEILVEEKFEFSYLEFTDLDTYLLEVALCVYCPDSRDEILGLCQVRLNYSNIETIQVLIKDLKSTHKKHDESYHGELLLTIAYLPGAERLTINVRKARNLDMIGLEKKEILPDPYVKVSVCDKDNNRLKKKKTATEKATTNPTFNQEVVFTNLKKEQLEKMVIRFSVYNDSIKNRECLGEVEFHSQSRGQRYAQWKNMIDGKKSSAWWHNLTVSDHSENEKSRFHNFINRSKSPSLRKDSIIDNFLF